MKKLTTCVFAYFARISMADEEHFDQKEDVMHNDKNNRKLATGLILAVIALSCLSQTWAQPLWERLPGDGSETDFKSVFFIDANTGWIAA